MEMIRDALSPERLDTMRKMLDAEFHDRSVDKAAAMSAQFRQRREEAEEERDRRRWKKKRRQMAGLR